MSTARFLALSMIALFAGAMPAPDARSHSTLSDITEGGEDRVTLPVIPQSRLIIHATRGIDVSSDDGTVQSLPLAVFLTLKTPEEVVAWYRERLPDFALLRSDSGKHAQILERVSGNTRIDGPDTYQIPNIRIRPTDARTATHMKGAKTMLQVYYRPAPEPDDRPDNGS